MGLCQNIESNIGHYYSNIDSECPAIDDQWKDIENNQSVSGKITRKITKIYFGSEVQKSPSAGIKFHKLGSEARNASTPGIRFYGLERRRRKRVQKCLDWKKVPLINEWKCFKFFPPLKTAKKGCK